MGYRHLFTLKLCFEGMNWNRDVTAAPHTCLLRFQPNNRARVRVQQEQWRTIELLLVLPTRLCLLRQNVDLLWCDGSLHCRRNRHCLLSRPAHCSVLNHFCGFMCTVSVFSVIVDRWIFLKRKRKMFFPFLAILLSCKRRHSHWGCNGRELDFVWALKGF